LKHREQAFPVQSMLIGVQSIWFNFGWTFLTIKANGLDQSPLTASCRLPVVGKLSRGDA
jgi:hypothetical protein